jgi:hypothetical protein
MMVFLPLTEHTGVTEFICHPACAGTQYHFNNSAGSGLNHWSRKGLMVGLIRDTCPAFKRDQRIRPKKSFSPRSLPVPP